MDIVIVVNYLNITSEKSCLLFFETFIFLFLFCNLSLKTSIQHLVKMAFFDNILISIFDLYNTII